MALYVVECRLVAARRREEACADGGASRRAGAGLHHAEVRATGKHASGANGGVAVRAVRGDGSNAVAACESRGRNAFTAVWPGDPPPLPVITGTRSLRVDASSARTEPERRAAAWAAQLYGKRGRQAHRDALGFVHGSTGGGDEDQMHGRHQQPRGIQSLRFVRLAARPTGDEGALSGAGRSAGDPVRKRWRAPAVAGAASVARCGSAILRPSLL